MGSSLLRTVLRCRNQQGRRGKAEWCNCRYNYIHELINFSSQHQSVSRRSCRTLPISPSAATLISPLDKCRANQSIRSQIKDEAKKRKGKKVLAMGGGVVSVKACETKSRGVRDPSQDNSALVSETSKCGDGVEL